MNNYEKIILALFAIQHNAYILQQFEDDERRNPIENETINSLRKSRGEAYDKVVPMLQEIMEHTGEILNGCAQCTGYDFALLNVPYDIVYIGQRRKITMITNKTNDYGIHYTLFYT